MDAIEIQRQADEAFQKYKECAPYSFSLFTEGLTIAGAHGPCLFRPVMSDFQKETFAALGPSLHAVLKGEMPPIRRFWIERTKKAAKDSDLAIALIWLTAFAERPMFCQVCAANRSQSGIIRRRVADILHYNPWLHDFIELQQYGFISKRLPQIVETKIEATDSKGGAHGETPDVLVLNELVHVAQWRAMEDHMNNAAGVPRGVVIVSTNAGFKGSKAEVWRDMAIINPKRWSCHMWQKTSPWISEEDVAEAKKRNTPSEFKRLWRGQWSSQGGDAVDEALIDKVFRDDIKIHKKPRKSWVYIAGLDLGIKKDHAGMAALGINRKKCLIRIMYAQSWKPVMRVEGSRNEVDSLAVKSACALVHKRFRLKWFGYDPAAGGSFMAQDLRRARIQVPMREVLFNQSNLTAMAISFMQVIEQEILECAINEEVRLDFKKFRIVAEIPTGYKLKAIADEHGHADVGMAVVLALPQAIQILGGIGGIEDCDFEGWDNINPLSKKEEKAMPAELREIYDMEDETKEDYHHRQCRNDRSL